MAEDVCYYDDKEYSEGSIIEVDGEFQQCYDANGTFLWGAPTERRNVGSGEEMSEQVVLERLLDDLGVTEATPVAKKKTQPICTYDNKKYSLGAKLKMPNGKMYQCTSGGKGPHWRPV